MFEKDDWVIVEYNQRTSHVNPKYLPIIKNSVPGVISEKKTFGGSCYCGIEFIGQPALLWFHERELIPYDQHEEIDYSIY